MTRLALCALLFLGCGQSASFDDALESLTRNWYNVGFSCGQEDIRIRSLLTRGDIAPEDEKTTTIWLMSVYYAVRSLKAKRRRENRSWPSMKS